MAIVLLHGYHPHADDAALYVAGIKHLSDATLYSAIDAPYLEVHGHWSIFEPVLAHFVRWSGEPVDVVLFAAYFVSVAFYLAGAYKLSRRLFKERSSHCAAGLLAAASFTLPIAGTSIVVMDPYVTARSFSGPLSLFAIEALLSGATLRAAALTLVASAFHPLMGFCLLLFQIVLFICLRSNAWKRRLIVAFALAIIAACMAANAVAAASPVDQLYRQVVWTRSYLFLSRWEWYEYIGLAAPILIAFWVWGRADVSPVLRRLCAVIVLVGTCITLACLVFVQPSGSLLLARVQMLRVFHPIYLVGIVMLGGWIGALYQKGSRAVLLFHVAVAASLFGGERYVYPASLHLEVPYRAESNPWHQGFLWISSNTPRQALFAADPHMIELPHEGKEGFRATAERSILADDKDGGAATLSPLLAGRWASQYRAQADLATESDRDRIANLAPYNVTWILLPPLASTHFECPYSNQVIKVCRLVPAESSKIRPPDGSVQFSPSSPPIYSR